MSKNSIKLFRVGKKAKYSAKIFNIIHAFAKIFQEFEKKIVKRKQISTKYFFFQKQKIIKHMFFASS